MTRRLLPLLVLLVLGALAAPGTALAVAPSSEFAKPPPAYVGETVTLKITTPDPDPLVTYSWDFGNASPPGSGPETSTSYGAAGEYAITVTATRPGLDPSTPEQSTTERVIRVGRPAPSTVKFTVSNTQPVVLESVDVDAPDAVIASDDYEKDGLSCSWEADGQRGIAEPGDCHTTITWTSPGTKDVTVTVKDVKGQTTEKTRPITVGIVAKENQPPTAPSLSYSPDAPVAGQRVTFTSRATDDGTIEAYEWDFNSDKVYESSGETTSHVFPASGNYTVTVRATDNNGASSTSFQTIFVSSPPAGEVLGTSNSGSPPTAPTPSSGQGQPRQSARLLSPFPIVRLRGSVVGRLVRINLLSVQGAPRGAKVRVRCRGGGCPRKLVTSTAQSSRRTMRLKIFERRLRAGAKLEIYVTQSGRLGKYTRFEIRRNAAPRRIDRCVRSFPGKPVTCPSAG